MTLQQRLKKRFQSKGFWLNLLTSSMIVYLMFSMFTGLAYAPILYSLVIGVGLSLINEKAVFETSTLIILAVSIVAYLSISLILPYGLYAFRLNKCKQIKVENTSSFVGDNLNISLNWDDYSLSLEEAIGYSGAIEHTHMNDYNVEYSCRIDFTLENSRWLDFKIGIDDQSFQVKAEASFLISGYDLDRRYIPNDVGILFDPLVSIIASTDILSDYYNNETRIQYLNTSASGLMMQASSEYWIISSPNNNSSGLKFENDLDLLYSKNAGFIDISFLGKEYNLNLYINPDTEEVGYLFGLDAPETVRQYVCQKVQCRETVSENDELNYSRTINYFDQDIESVIETLRQDL